MKHYALFHSSIVSSAIVTVLILNSISIVGAQVRSSSNYQLQSDSINVGGGLSNSASYIQESTVGEIATGPSDSTTYSLRAGYQQMQEVFISLATTGDVTMSPDLPGITGGTSNGSSTMTVVTDSPSGYQLVIQAENEPAMQSGANTIADYEPVSDADFVFTVNSGEAYFGFSPEGVDITNSFLDNTTTCGVGATDTSLACWAGLATTTQVIAEATSANHPAGATTTVNFRVGIGNGAGVVSGLYTATTTVTALPL